MRGTVFPLVHAHTHARNSPATSSKAARWPRRPGGVSMTVTVLMVAVVIVLALGLFVFRAIPAVRAYFGYRGKRLITCPETHTTAAVDVAAGEAAVGAFLTEPTLRLKECSRWPERQDCGQACLQQI